MGLKRFPERIVPLDPEIGGVLRKLGAGNRVLEVDCGYRNRSGSGASQGESSRTEQDLETVLDLEPDLILSVSEEESALASGLLRKGVQVLSFHPARVAGILKMIRVLGGVLGLEEAGRAYSEELRESLERVRERGEMLLRRPRTFLEVWPDPLKSGAGWVGELLEIAGGEDTFPELRGSRARSAVVDPAEAAGREPEVIIAAWPGGSDEIALIRGRSGWERVPAIRRERIFRVDGALLLHPGPTALTEGVEKLHAILAEASLG
jgi:iron complex transport system substrate-binding protein